MNNSIIAIGLEYRNKFIDLYAPIWVDLIGMAVIVALMLKRITKLERTDQNFNAIFKLY